MRVELISTGNQQERVICDKLSTFIGRAADAAEALHGLREAALEGHQLAVEACAMQCGRSWGRAVTKDCRGINGALAAQEQRVL